MYNLHHLACVQCTDLKIQTGVGVQAIQSLYKHNHTIQTYTIHYTLFQVTSEGALYPMYDFDSTLSNDT